MKVFNEIANGVFGLLFAWFTYVSVSEGNYTLATLTAVVCIFDFGLLYLSRRASK